jgi:hypothetical protein
MFTLEWHCPRGAKESIIGVQIGCDRGWKSRRNAGVRGRRGKTLEAEIDELLREKEEVAKWATVGSA